MWLVLSDEQAKWPQSEMEATSTLDRALLVVAPKMTMSNYKQNPQISSLGQDVTSHISCLGRVKLRSNGHDS